MPDALHDILDVLRELGPAPYLALVIVVAVCAQALAWRLGSGGGDTLDGEAGRRRAPAAHLTARTPFDPPVGHGRLQELTDQGWRVTRTRLTDAFPLERFRETHGDDAVLLFLQHGERRLEVVTEKTRLPDTDAVLYALVPGDE